MNTNIKYKTILTAIALGCFSIVNPASAGTVENMERERAVLLNTLLFPEGSDKKVTQKLEISRDRLIDLERMVIRDKSLRGKNTPAVRSAFANYDLTFLVHSSIEKNTNVLEHWLNEVGVSTSSLQAARIGRR